ncbi:MAG: hypothetical protein ABJH98_17810 [Reichenbachiella sp.]|uniref:hypothetical protein n=1 Tax=Reichenbachiella sp. TaxID=2184521 RepID=UPI0032641608
MKNLVMLMLALVMVVGLSNCATTKLDEIEKMVDEKSNASGSTSHDLPPLP